MFLWGYNMLEKNLRTYGPHKGENMKKGFFVLLSLTLILASVFGATFGKAPVTAFAEDDFKDSYYATTYTHPSKIVAAPTVVYDLTSKEGLEGLKTATKKPTNVMMEMDGDGNIVTPDGQVIDTFDNVYRKTLKKDMIPVVKVYTAEAATAFTEYISGLLAFNDIAVMSNDGAILKSVRDALPYIRGVYESPLGEIDLFAIIKAANVAKATTVVIPRILATTSNVRYLQGMFKTVWAKWTGQSEIDLSDVVFSGAYGVVTEDYNKVYDFFDKITAAAGEGKVFTRTPFIIGHRGDAENCHENSLSGVLSAIEGGATHVEIDVHLTSDKKLVVMHDNTIDATTTGTGTIKNMTLAQIQSHKLKKNGLEMEDIPVFKDIVMGMLEKEDDDTILILELKCTGTQVVDVLTTTLESDDELSAILDRMVIITFYADQLKALMKRLPEIPAAYLTNSMDMKSSISAVLKLINENNATLDTSSGKVNQATNEEKFIARGVICWTWTHSARSDVEAWQDLGFIGLTTNQPTTTDKYFSANGIETAVPEVPKAGDKVSLTRTTYDGKTSTVEGTISFVEGIDDKNYKVVATYTDGERTYYTQSFTLTHIMEKDGFPGWMLIMVIVIIVAAAVGVVFINKYKNKK